ncbi:MAG: metal-transporting ATPase, partial [Clostridiales bacterium]|nr:metal-transporting ATPase [Clostridiales bacterium]
VAAAVRLSRKTLRNIHENLFWAFFYNIICIPLAAGAFVWEMNPMIGAAAMSISSFTVCMNALRLNLFKMHDASHDRPMKDQINEKIIIEQERKDDMEKTLKVEGMMCEHCEAMVKKTLEALDFISYAQPNHNDNEVKIKVEGDLDEAKIKEVIEDRGYNYLGIK